MNNHNELRQKIARENIENLTAKFVFNQNRLSMKKSEQQK